MSTLSVISWNLSSQGHYYLIKCNKARKHLHQLNMSQVSTIDLHLRSKYISKLFVSFCQIRMYMHSIIGEVHGSVCMYSVLCIWMHLYDLTRNKLGVV